jgi:hypothetical protein
MKIIIVFSTALILTQAMLAQVNTDPDWMKYSSGDQELMIMPTAYTM